MVSVSNMILLRVIREGSNDNMVQIKIKKFDEEWVKKTEQIASTVEYHRIHLKVPEKAGKWTLS